MVNVRCTTRADAVALVGDAAIGMIEAAQIGVRTSIHDILSSDT